MTRNAGPAQDLGPRQERFVDEYLIDLNAKQAAIGAGHSPKTAEVEGSRLLSNVTVQRALSKAMDRRAAKVEIDQEWVLSRLALGFVQPGTCKSLFAGHMATTVNQLP